MIDGILLIRGAEIFALFIVVKALYEGCKTARWKTHETAHKRAHIVVALSIAFYNLFDVFSFVWFEQMNDDGVDYTISFFNLAALNVVWLFVINHLRQERRGDIHKSNIRELLKF